MRRIAAIAALLATATLAVFGQAASGDGDEYEVRAIFDNGGFLVPGEEVRVAGATVGSVSSVDVTLPDEAVHRDGTPDPGKAVVVMKIDETGFQDFRQDADCLIRPQSLLGEKYVDCQPTMPRAPGSEPPPPLEEVPDGEPGRRAALPAAGEHQQGSRHRPDQQHHARALRRPLPADLQRPGGRFRGPRRGPRGDHPARRPGAAPDEPGPGRARSPEPAARQARARRRHDPGSRSPASAAPSPDSSTTRTSPRRRPRSAARTSRPASSASPRRCVSCA